MVLPSAASKRMRLDLGSVRTRTEPSEVVTKRWRSSGGAKASATGAPQRETSIDWSRTRSWVARTSMHSASAAAATTRVPSRHERNATYRPRLLPPPPGDDDDDDDDGRCRGVPGLPLRGGGVEHDDDAPPDDDGVEGAVVVWTGGGSGKSRAAVGGGGGGGPALPSEEAGSSPDTDDDDDDDANRGVVVVVVVRRGGGPPVGTPLAAGHGLGAGGGW
mmetsp:Transcript_20015/g.79826  ORF Transcript_20015/g.79826 Transcript_20015/m.79826 type:complete len:218 (-) Transcript_20015:73-726(-)